MKNLFIDLEVIVANNGEALQNAIEKVEPKASKKYIDKILKMFIEEMMSGTEYRQLLDEAYDLKDRLLEEVDDKYKGKIDFKSLYRIDDFNQGMVDYIRKISETIDTHIIFYYNTEREYKEKELVCNTFFPSCKVIGIRFYQQPYDPSVIRKRTNKALYIKNLLGLDSLDECMLIDKSGKSCEEWNELNGDATVYHNKQNTTIVTVNNTKESMKKIIK